MQSADLLASLNRVETPFISVEIAGVSFGVYNESMKNPLNGLSSGYIKTTYPNFMRSLSITKLNGAVNTYSIQMVYQITKGDDPNLLEKVFSKAKDTRTIYISYGDLSLPTYVFKREEALITDVKSNIDFAGSKITYTVNCVSKALLGNSIKLDFPKRTAKPSDLILELLYNRPDCGLLELFYGMNNKQNVIKSGIIASDDISTTIEAKTNITPIEYLKYLVSCMQPANEEYNTLLKSSIYRFNIVDDITGDFGGPYFKVTKLSRNIRKDTIDVYNIDIGFPGNNIITNFSVDDDQVYSILYDYSKDVEQPSYIQRIDNDGNVISEYSPAIAKSSRLLRTTSAEKTWWSNMVNYPINVSLTVKGLLKPAVLMSYVYIDARFFGAQHYVSGYYIITKQVDNISSSGYRTTLSLLRVGGDLENDYQSNN